MTVLIVTGLATVICIAVLTFIHWDLNRQDREIKRRLGKLKQSVSELEQMVKKV